MKAIKQKHGKENTIGKIIYGFLLFMPLLAIATTCAYVIFNKNAYHSYYGETINDYQNVRVDFDNLEENETYHIDIDYIDNSNSLSQTTFYVSYIKNLSADLEYDMTIYNRLRFFKNANTNQVYTQLNRIDGGSSLTITTNVTIEFTYISTQYIGTISPYLNIYQVQYEKLTYLSSSFYYAINEVENSALFNWSYNTATYNVLETTCNTLGITNNFVPMMLSYWLMISLMYLLYDIALLVVHMAHNRIHDIESSI